MATSDAYTRIEMVGEGTYGVVYKCRRSDTGAIVAMKKIRLDDDDEGQGVPPTTIREIAVLRELSILADAGPSEAGAEHIVRLLDVIYDHPSKLCLVFEFIDSVPSLTVALATVLSPPVQDLKRFQDMAGTRVRSSPRCDGDPPDGLHSEDLVSHTTDRALPLDLVKKLTRQLVLGISFLHKRRILHRDLKPQNLLISRHGHLKIADFGLSRTVNVPHRTYTHEVVTLWYRAPEVLLGTRHYATSIDIWSMGCIITEMASGVPLFCGDSEIDQLYRIFRLRGTPSTESWDGLEGLPDYQPCFPKWSPQDLQSHIPRLDADGITLVAVCRKQQDHGIVCPKVCQQHMLVYQPAHRISAKAALLLPFLRGSAPLPLPVSDPLSTPTSMSTPLSRSSSTAFSDTSTLASSPAPPTSPCATLMASPT